jgi:hypothetical protein
MPVAQGMSLHALPSVGVEVGLIVLGAAAAFSVLALAAMQLATRPPFRRFVARHPLRRPHISRQMTEDLIAECAAFLDEQRRRQHP